jgi:hypothetical protein
MPKPRVFISSTFFDLKQIRTDLDRFIRNVGYEPVRNETGEIPYGKEEKIEEYCYKEIGEVDILIGIIGGRFGSQSAGFPYSISQVEIRTALDQNKQVYIFIDKGVYAEYETFKMNKGNDSIRYKYDSRIHLFIEEIEILPKNNPIQDFETADDIIEFLRKQWAGLFRKFLNYENQQVQLNSMTHKINELSELGTTLKRYLEEVMQGVNLKPTEVNKVIAEESERLDIKKRMSELSSIGYIRHLRIAHKIEFDKIFYLLKVSHDFDQFRKEVVKMSPDKFSMVCINEKEALEDINEARRIMGLEDFAK